MGAAPILTILKDGETIRSVPIEGDALLGRSEGCVIRLEDRAISRQHAVFRRKGDHVQVEKKSEFAPLMVNGAECTLAVLKEGDVISIGPYLMKLSMQPAQERQAAPESLAPLAGAALVEPVTAPLENAPDLALNQVVEAPAEITGPMEAESAPGLESLPEIVAPVAADQGPFSLDPPSSSASIEEGERTSLISQDQPFIGLSFKPGDANVTDYQIQNERIFIGRGKDCEIVLNDKKASRKNSEIVRNGWAFTIRDLNSSNGTFVNGQKVTEHELSGGDLIRIGGIEFAFKAEMPGYEEQQKDFMTVPTQTDSDAQNGLPQLRLDGTDDPMAMPPGQQPEDFNPALPMPVGVSYQPSQAAQAVAQGMGTSIPGIAGIPGLAGAAGAGARKPKSLIEKFRALPKGRQYIVIVCIIALFYFLMDDPPEPVKNVVKGKATQVKKTGDAANPATANGTSGSRSWAALSPDQKKYVETQHDLAFNYYKNMEFDKALFEIEKIFSIVQDYKDSREIERYAKEGKRKMEALAEEKRKREDAEALKQKVADLVNEARDKMQKKKYKEATDLFSQILALDPENTQVSAWQAQIQQYEEDLRISAEKKQVQQEIARQARAVYQEGLHLRKQGKLRSAIAMFAKVKEVDPDNHKVIGMANAQIKGIHEQIRAMIEPMLNDAKGSDDSGNYIKALELYDKVLVIEPREKTAIDSIARVKGILTERAKGLYTEAVLAESYSDFATAKKKFHQCMATAPKDSIYRDRASRKLARYFKQDDNSAPGGGDP